MIDPNKHGIYNKKGYNMSEKKYGMIGLIILNTIIWYNILTNGFFITLTWLIVISAIVGLWMRLTGRG